MFEANLISQCMPRNSFLPYRLNRVFIGISIAGCSLVIIYVVKSIFTKLEATFYKDPKRRNFENRVLFYQKSVDNWEKNREDQKSFKRLVETIEKIVYHSFFLFRYGLTEGRQGAFLKDCKKDLSQLQIFKDNILTNSQQDVVRSIIKKINSLLIAPKSVYETKALSLQECLTLESEGQDYLKEPLPARDFLQHAWREWTWYLALKGFKLNEESVLLKNEYDYWQTKLAWSFFTD